jgi:hypothetical protein
MAETNNLLCGKAAAVPAPKVEEAKDTDSKDKLIVALKASFDHPIQPPAFAVAGL